MYVFPCMLLCTRVPVGFISVICVCLCVAGVNDTRYTVLSHLGNLLKAGDTVMGYDLSTAVLAEGEEADSLPDVVLVKKVCVCCVCEYVCLCTCACCACVCVPLYGPVGASQSVLSARLRAAQVYHRDPKKRQWKLARLEKGGAEEVKGGEEEEAKQEEDFLQDLEEDKTLRAAVNIFKGEGVCVNGTFTFISCRIVLMPERLPR